MRTSVLTTAIAFFAISLGTSGEPVVHCQGKTVVDPGPCLTYDFIDLEFGVFSASDTFLDDGDQFELSFSKSLGEMFFLTGGYTNAGIDYLFNNTYFDLETHRYSLGLGARFALAECLDLTIEGGGNHVDFRPRTNTQLSYDSWGYYVGPGLRARSGRLEGYVKVFYEDREGTNPPIRLDHDGWVFRPGVLFHLTDTFAFKAAGEIRDNVSAVTFGARIHF